MANSFYQAPQVAALAVELAATESSLLSLISRDLQDDLLGGGGKGRTVNVKIPTALVARTRGIDDKTTSIVLDELSETTVPITLGTHAYSAVSLSDGDLTLNLRDFGAQVLAPQVEAVVAYVDQAVITAIRSIPLISGTAAAGNVKWDAANPAKTFTAIRKLLRDRGVAISGLNCIVGTSVYAALLDSGQLKDASQSGSAAALRDAQVGRIAGFDIVESTLVDDGEIVAFHRNAFVAAIRPPVTSPGASFGATITANGYGLRYLRDYLVDKTVDRSMVSTFVGVAAMPLYKITRNLGTGDNAANASASVDVVPGGAAFRMSIEDTEPAS